MSPTRYRKPPKAIPPTVLRKTDLTALLMLEDRAVPAAAAKDDPTAVAANTMCEQARKQRQSKLTSKSFQLQLERPGGDAPTQRFFESAASQIRSCVTHTQTQLWRLATLLQLCWLGPRTQYSFFAGCVRNRLLHPKSPPFHESDADAAGCKMLCAMRCCTPGLPADRCCFTWPSPASLCPCR